MSELSKKQREDIENFDKMVRNAHDSMARLEKGFLSMSPEDQEEVKKTLAKNNTPGELRMLGELMKLTKEHVEKSPTKDKPEK